MDLSASALKKLARRHGFPGATPVSTASISLPTRATNSWLKSSPTPSRKQKGLRKNRSYNHYTKLPLKSLPEEMRSRENVNYEISEDYWSRSWCIWRNGLWT